MAESVDAINQTQRLRRALEALSADLDAIEQRPHLLLRTAAANLEDDESHGVECFMDHFAFAVRNGTMR